MRLPLPSLEPICRRLPGPREILRHAFGHNLANGLAAFLFAASGPGAMILAVGTAANLPAHFIASWLFSAYTLSGLLTLVFCALYRQPLAIGYSMPAVVIIGPALTQYPFAELIGAYIVTGALILGLALTGLVRRATAALPEPIVMAMIAGVFLPFGLRLMGAFDDAAAIASAMAVAYLAAAAFPIFRERVPPLLAALLGGAIAVAVTGGFTPPAGLTLQTASPILFAPVFSTEAIVEFSIPLAVTVVAIHNIQGFAILRSAGYQPPENAATLTCGAATPYYGIMGSVPTVVMGPANAILNVSGSQAFRYIGGLWFGLFLILFGVYAPTAVAIGGALPTAFIAGLAGLAMLPVLQSAFVESFRGRFTFGALVTLLVTVADIQILGIGSAFWGLVFGYVASRLVESGDFRARKEALPA